MKVYGQEVPQKAYDAIERALHDSDGITAAELYAVVSEVVNPTELHSYTFVERWLKREKRRGNIVYVNRLWRRTEDKRRARTNRDQ